MLAHSMQSGDIFYMLIDLKITLIKLCQGNKARRLQELKDALESKDFENGLYNQLVCLYTLAKSHSLTNFRTLSARIGTSSKFPLDFSRTLSSDLNWARRSLKLLTNIRSSIKTTLTTSIVKRTSIADVTRSLAPSGSGMEVDSTHWNRIALLRRLLRIFLIGVSNYKTASIKYLFSPYLIPLLKQDLRDKVACELDIDVKQLERDIFKGDFDDVPETDVNPSQAPTETQVNTNHAPSARRDTDMNVEQFADESGMQQDANGEDEESNVSSSANSVVLLDNPLDSGFGLAEGMAVQYNSTTKFWNFVDHSLSIMRKISVESSPIVTEQDKELQKLFIEIFQADLAEFPGGKKVSKLISKTNPRWQTAIQTGLIW
ncbi:hypothetical protein EV424DRAFT_1545625 [Suillus variegatus]|nr:hypothetical protein EV424DRAFT_1545625 [Suillus variegatus]